LFVGDRAIQHGILLRADVGGTVDSTADGGADVQTAGGKREHASDQEHFDDRTAQILPTLHPMCHSTLFAARAISSGRVKRMITLMGSIDIE
jgi:hypothetical protein